MPAQVSALRELLERRFPGTVPLTHHTTPVAATGLSALDGILPGGGLPRGRLSVWAPGPGATALIRAACTAAVGRRERAAWVDAEGVSSGEASWAGVALVRPEDPHRALRCAEELLRSGGFGVVVLAGAPTAGAARVRLSRAAREGGGALVEIATDGFMAGLRLASWVSAGGYHWRRNVLGEATEVETVGVRVRATALGWDREADVLLTVASHALRLSLEPALGDRRGAAR